jgi:hypothetical protein
MVRKLLGLSIVPALALVLAVSSGPTHAQGAERASEANLQDVHFAHLYNVYYKENADDDWVFWKRVRGRTHAAAEVRYLRSQGYFATAQRI